MLLEMGLTKPTYGSNSNRSGSERENRGDARKKANGKGSDHRFLSVFHLPQ